MRFAFSKSESRRAMQWSRKKQKKFQKNIRWLASSDSNSSSPHSLNQTWPKTVNQQKPDPQERVWKTFGFFFGNSAISIQAFQCKDFNKNINFSNSVGLVICIGRDLLIFGFAVVNISALIDASTHHTNQGGYANPYSQYPSLSCDGRWLSQSARGWRAHDFRRDALIEFYFWETLFEKSFSDRRCLHLTISTVWLHIFYQFIPAIWFILVSHKLLSYF